MLQHGIAEVQRMTENIAAALSYDAKGELFRLFPRMRDFSKRSNARMEAIGACLARREWDGHDTSYARAALWDVRWRTNATSDLDAAERALARLEEAVATEEPGSASDQDRHGSFGRGTKAWFLKLDRSTDQLLARGWAWRIAPYFLEEIDDPVRMVTYLQDLTWCDVARRGCDTRKELNLAISVIARLVMRGGQAGYLSGPGFLPALERFIAGWRQRETGFFGVTYVTDDLGTEATTRDLSLTFHMVRYLPHLVVDWQTLVDTLLGQGSRPYPEGWLDGGRTMSDHNNYDVAEIFHRGWRFMRPDQRRAAAGVIDAMLDWCLSESVTSDGEVRHPDTGDMVPDSYYFAAAFLDTVGFFDRGKRFWTARDWPDAERIRAGMGARMGRFNPHLTVVGDTLERLNVRRRRTSIAVL